MADLQDLAFDATKEEPAGFSALPAGKYAACIVDSEKKETKAGTGHYLQLKIQITKGPYKNRTVYDRLNLWNANQQAVQIARGTFSSLCRAVDILSPNDSSELHNKPFLVTLKTREYQGDTQNEVKGYATLPLDFEPGEAADGPDTPW